MYHGVPRAAQATSHRLAGEYENPAKQHGAPNGFLRCAQAARATEFHEDRRTATMNISPGPWIIIRNEIALESLINRRTADAVALGMRGLQVPKATTAIFRIANHRPFQYYLPALHWNTFYIIHIIQLRYLSISA